jgi:hypothetical protein
MGGAPTGSVRRTRSTSGAKRALQEFGPEIGSALGKGRLHQEHCEAPPLIPFFPQLADQ